MTTELTMPKLAMSMTEGELTEWLVEDGATVAAGQPIYSVEADKSTQEIEAPVAGVLRRIGVAGETYEVGVKIGEIG
jgi:pyruvate/2-oxoglutarate dehydrogenase complex dihydrolipoamide acyltransferase (E2) component